MSELFDEIAQALARRTGSEDTRVSEVIHAFFSGVEKELLRGEKQSIPGLGQFQFKEGRVHFKPAKILRDWLVENTIPDGPLPENLLLNETQKSILQNLETSYPDLPALDELNLEQEKTVEVKAKGKGQEESKEVEKKENSDQSIVSKVETATEVMEKKDPASATPKEAVAVKPATQAPPTPASVQNTIHDENRKLKIVLYAVAGAFALTLLLVAVFSIPWPRPQKIHFRDVKVPASETLYYRVAVPPSR